MIAFEIIINIIVYGFLSFLYWYLCSELKKAKKLLNLMQIGISNRDRAIEKMARTMGKKDDDIDWIKKYYQSRVEIETLKKALREKENE